MFRSIQDRFSRRLEGIKTKNQSQTDIEKSVRAFLSKEFGAIGETLGFNVSQENKKLNIRLENKIAANELVLRSGRLKEFIRQNNSSVETINID